MLKLFKYNNTIAQRHNYKKHNWMWLTTLEKISKIDPTKCQT